MASIVYRQLNKGDIHATAVVLCDAFETGDTGVELWTALIERELESERVDPSLSRIAVAGDQVVAACLVNAGWRGVSRIGPTGVSPGARRNGVGRELIRHCISALSERRSQRIVLEVAPSNHAAIALYEGAGFHDHRGLSTWTARRSDLSARNAPAAKSADASEVVYWLADLDTEPAFQRLPEYIQSFSVGLRAYAVHDDSGCLGALIQRGRELLAIAALNNDSGVISSLLWAAAGFTWELRLMHQVDEDPLSAVLSDLGFCVASRAREMVRTMS